ncbi:hypothetical protein B9Z36_02330 [Limnohabitans sp. Rim8]|uniref:DUF3306 domain-containing protein n=1 Tax=Limnohabitans sp. Rim8 TaxID=1100718 RepID=UPI000D3D58A0|nr:DUF3306 domain-containing protein [Limnohabitans sp. Rim8]PUE62413.1 hypothetical protein B9Z36_02330 [Limnohabitans sp. Rim8]
MANDDTPAGFLSRWSRRKADVREGRPLAELTPAPSGAEPGKLPTRAPNAAAFADTASPVARAAQTHESEARPAPTLADTQQLTPESDFTGFMARGVAPDVKNAAMKKLFTDPHFNVMDRMDIYIDDYSQPDPLPMAMLRQMTSAKTLNLFDDEPEKTVEANVGDKPALEEPKVVAQSVPADNHSNIEPTTHDHADLRLQPDPTTRPEGTEPKPV